MLVEWSTVLGRHVGRMVDYVRKACWSSGRLLGRHVGRMVDYVSKSSWSNGRLC